MNLNHSLEALRKAPEAALDHKAVLLGKHKLLAEINRRQEARKGYILSWSEAFRFMWMRTIRKMIPAERTFIAFLLIFSVMTSTTYMAQAAVPGDMLWPLKLTYEKAEIALAMDPVYEGRLHIKHVDNRLKELTVVITQPNTKQKSQSISQLVRRLEKDITAADQSLKLAKEEKKDSEPQVVIALAQDLSEKALEAVTVLEDNHEALIAAEDSQGELVADSLPAEGSSATSTEAAVEVDAATATTVPTSSAPLTDSEKENAQAAGQAAKVVAEVQAINLEVSYSALKSMIDIVENAYTSVNRPEITFLTKQKVTKVAALLASLQEKIDLINDDFILHRIELRSLSKKTSETLKLADDLANLDNLSGSFKKTQEAKELIVRMNGLLDEVAAGNGFNPKEEPMSLQKQSVPQQVRMQGLDDPESDVLHTDEGVVFVE